MSRNEVIINNQKFKVPTDFVNQTKNFIALMLLYDCAVREITTKLEILDKELGTLTPRNPITTIKSRVKKPQSIVEKLLRLQVPLNVESIPLYLNDVAGVRVICSYIDDIYIVADMISKQDDIRVIEIKDYIRFPKDNGYRSLHMIVEVPVFLSDGKHGAKVEIQIRTIAMDFWASLEHEIRYKKDHRHIESVSEALFDCAETIAKTDQKMLDIRNLIDDEPSQ
ncbi:GTP pyrophosphokinase [Erysipelothrix tonsillarum]|uniref:GTP pyrophosphokinase n=1 Tax=Erysipelothrix tonsillarum TaxID=38402 RepID=UPI00035EBFFC|nr:GTP pyrophosphokinase family protein [Erysipelothrix tonsillarum]